MLEEKSIDYCRSNNRDIVDNQKMSIEVFEKGIAFAKRNFFLPVLLHGEGKLSKPYLDLLEDVEFMNISKGKNEMPFGEQLMVIDESNISEVDEPVGNCILKVNAENIHKLFDLTKLLFNYTSRINVFIEEPEAFNDEILAIYGQQLDAISELLVTYYKAQNFKMINVLTDILFIEKSNHCSAGINSMTLGVNGKFYMCPSFYYDNKEEPLAIDLGEQVTEINATKSISLEKAPLCRDCRSYQCTKCVYLNKKLTRHYNIPSYMQCKISHLELRKSYELQQQLESVALPVEMVKLDRQLLENQINERGISL